MVLPSTRGSRAAAGRTTRPLRASSAPNHDNDDSMSDASESRKTTTAHTKRLTVRKTQAQVARLQQEYAIDPRPSKEARKRLSMEIGLDEKIVTTWFRDERSKNKKEALRTGTGGIGPVRNVGDRRANTRRSAFPASDVEEDVMGLPSTQTHKPFQATPLSPFAKPSGALGLFNGPTLTPSPSPAQSYLHLSPVMPPGQRSRVVRIREEVLTLNKPAPSPSVSPRHDNVEIEIDDSHVDEYDDSGSEPDDEPAQSLYTPATTYRSVVSPAIRSDINLPSLSSQFTKTFPAIPESLHLPPPQGWTSAWRWDKFGQCSDIRSTLDDNNKRVAEPAKVGRTSTLYTSGILSRDLASSPSPLPGVRSLLLPTQYDMREQSSKDEDATVFSRL